MSVWENGLQIAKLNGPRIFISEGREPVENTGFVGQIVFSWFIVGSMWQNRFFVECNNIRLVTVAGYVLGKIF